MAANCKVLDFVNNWMARKRYGISCDTLSNDPLIDYFRQDCDPSICPIENDTCETAQFFLCNFNVNQIQIELISLYDVRLSVIGFNGGQSPYTYLWNVDPQYYDIISQSNNTLIIRRIVEQSFVTDFTVKVTDTNGCITNKSKQFNFDYDNYYYLLSNGLGIF